MKWIVDDIGNGYLLYLQLLLEPLEWGIEDARKVFHTKLCSRLATNSMPDRRLHGVEIMFSKIKPEELSEHSRRIPELLQLAGLPHGTAEQAMILLPKVITQIVIDAKQK